MKFISLEELKKIEFNLLLQFKKVCEREGFRYSLTAGTLLGAVRHKGFIPWDDDIDVCMPRPDYEKFINFCMTNETSFELICKKNNSSYGYFFAKIYDDKTVIIEEDTNPNELPIGIYIDIFPIDAMGSNWLSAQIDFFKGALIKRLLIARNWKHYFRSKTYSIYVEPIRYVFYLLSRGLSMKKMLRLLDKIYKIDDRCYEDSKFVGSLSCDYNYKKIYPKKLFEEYISIPFEGEHFACVKQYDYLLWSLYGDYMKIPPIEKQVTHHSFRAYMIEKNNRKYCL